MLYSYTSIGLILINMKKIIRYIVFVIFLTACFDVSESVDAPVSISGKKGEKGKKSKKRSGGNRHVTGGRVQEFDQVKTQEIKIPKDADGKFVFSQFLKFNLDDYIVVHGWEIDNILRLNMYYDNIIFLLKHLMLNCEISTKEESQFTDLGEIYKNLNKCFDDFSLMVQQFFTFCQISIYNRSFKPSPCFYVGRILSYQSRLDELVEGFLRLEKECIIPIRKTLIPLARRGDDICHSSKRYAISKTDASRQTDFVKSMKIMDGEEVISPFVRKIGIIKKVILDPIIKEFSRNEGSSLDLDIRHMEDACKESILLLCVNLNAEIKRELKCCLDKLTQNDMEFLEKYKSDINSVEEFFKLKLEIEEKANRFGYLADNPQIEPTKDDIASSFDLKPKLNKLSKLVNKYRDLIPKIKEYWLSDDLNPKLLIGTVRQFFQFYLDDDKETLSLTQIDEQLKQVYKEQCDVSRKNWLKHLGFSDARTPLVNQSEQCKACHYTIYKNSIITSGIASVSVYRRSEEDVLSKLFCQGESAQQVHATLTFEGCNYHRYWNGTYSPNVKQHSLDDKNTKEFKKLNEEFNRMKKNLTEKVKKAIVQHGRIGDNTRATQIKL